LLENFMQLRSSFLILVPDKFKGSSDMLLKKLTIEPRREGSPGNRSFKQFLRSRDGGIAVFGVFLMPVLAGFVGMGLDMSVWYAMKRDVQGIADAAAIGAVQTQFQGGDATAVQAGALADAQLNGYSVGSGNSLTVTEVSNTVGALTETVQVTARLRAPMRFAGFFLDDIFVSAFATAGFELMGEQCILALDESADKALDFGGTANVTVGCGVHSNSDSPSSISVSGNATLVADPATAHGGINISGGGQIISDYPWVPFTPQVDNPYESMAMPSKPAACDYTGHSVEPSETATFDAAASGGSIRFCDGLDLKGDVTFTAGTYFIDEGTFRRRRQHSDQWRCRGDDQCAVGGFRLAPGWHGHRPGPVRRHPRRQQQDQRRWHPKHQRGRLFPQQRDRFSRWVRRGRQLSSDRGPQGQVFRQLGPRQRSRRL
jgi:hypothetical protein